MKIFLLPVLSFLILAACEKDNNTPPSGEVSKLLTGISEDGRVIEFIYDSINRLIQMNTRFNDTVSFSEYYEYDEDDKLKRRSFNDYIESYEYTDDGKLKSVELYYPVTEKTWRTEYYYRGDRMDRGISSYNGSPTEFLFFLYDSKGNTISRTSYYGDAIMSQRKYQYDDKVNPLKCPGIIPVDVVQINNPTYSYHFESIMSMYPPEYNSTYVYDEDGLPVKEFRQFKHTDEPRILSYEYSARNPVN
jgi:hypothetical protein